MCLFNIIDGGKPEEVVDMMFKNFWRGYTGSTRAPIGYYTHAAWFFQAWHYEGYKMFLQNITTYDDVWIVPVIDGLRYTQNPVPNQDLLDGKFEPFNCDDFPIYDCDPVYCR